jgi:hypothetical protein
MHNCRPFLIKLDSWMTKRKYESQLIVKDENNFFKPIPADIGGLIADYLPVNDILRVMSLSNTTRRLFKPSLAVKMGNKARACVVQGNLDTLIRISQAIPEALFQKGGIIDPRGRIFYDASAFQLIHFLCDVKMKNRLTRFIPNKFNHQRRQQIAELGSGGADLVKLARNPLSVSSNGFEGFTEFKQTFTLDNGKQREVSFPLLENIDGIIYYQDKHNDVHFYYVNRLTQDIIPLEPNIHSEEDQKSLTTFKASFATMEMNSARRSSDREHQLITQLFQRTLHRQGLHYQHHGVRYQDSCTAFRLINAYRTCIRLYEEARFDEYHAADDYWRRGVGLLQGEEVWLLQGICSSVRTHPFYYWPSYVGKSKRRDTFYDFCYPKPRSVFVAGNLITTLGSGFALYKGNGIARSTYSAKLICIAVDLVAICRLVVEAKASIFELEPESEEDLQSSQGPQA